MLKTEAALRAVEHTYEFGIDQPEWTMWLAADRFLEHRSSELSLSKVVDEEAFELLHAIRTEIETNSGVQDQELIKKFIDDVRQKISVLGGSWYIAKQNELPIGQIGIVPFDFESSRVGRLQNVNILPSHQSRGLGTQLIAEMCHIATKMKLSALCLMARTDDWPKDWYNRLGFTKCGQTEKLS